MGSKFETTFSLNVTSKETYYEKRKILSFDQKKIHLTFSTKLFGEILVSKKKVLNLILKI